MKLFYILAGFGLYDIYKYFIEKIRNNFIKYTFLIFFYGLPSVFLINSVWMVNQHSMNEHYYKAGIWLKNNSPSESKIACFEVDFLGWYSERYIIDVCGLVSPRNNEFIEKKEFDKWAEYYKPDYILVHNPIWEPGFEQTFIRYINKNNLIEIPGFKFKGIKLYGSP